MKVTAARPSRAAKTTLMLMSLSVRRVACWLVAAFLTSPTERLMPPIRLLRIRNRVKAALISMPPMATVLTMFWNTEVETSVQLISPASTAGWYCGASSSVSSGTNRPQERTPPAKLSAASRGPMM